MLTRLLIIFLCAVLPELNSNAQTANEVDVASLKGKVHSLRENSFAVKGRGDKIRKGKPKREYNTQRDYFIEFDTAGRRISKVVYNRDGSVERSSNYSYDSLGFLAREITLTRGATVADTTNFINEYNDKGMPIKRTTVFPKPNQAIEFIYTYDALQNINVSYRSRKDSAVLRESAVYNSKWVLQKTWIYDMKGSVLFVVDHAYDSSGRRIEEKFTDSKGTPVLYYRWKYDANGILERREVCGTSGKSCEAWTFKYEFDNIGNWIKATEYRNGKPVFIKERIITYY